MAASPPPVRVDLGPRSYLVHIAPGLLDGVGRRMARLGYRGRAAVVTQPAPGRLYAARLLASLAGAGFDARLVRVPDGEKAKTLAQASRLYDRFVALRLDRWSPVVALGGGVVGDLAGFAAGTFMRGLPFFQVPTTLVSQVDSGVGGKVAVNHPAGKNLVGLFHQPRAVFIDPDTLASLPRRDLVAGMAEVIRYAAIADAGFWAFLDRNMARLLRRERAPLAGAIRRCCAVKAGIVARDERETGDARALLNYGHTVGHALEAAAGYGRYRHGEAVAVGMAVAARLAFSLGVASRATMDRQINLLQKAGLPATLRGISAQRIVNSLKLDKKIKNGKIRFVLTEAIGRARVFENIDAAQIEAAVSAVTR